eukprot:1151471-Pelagomonas_calceolata.AAC.4
MKADPYWLNVQTSASVNEAWKQVGQWSTTCSNGSRQECQSLHNYANVHAALLQPGWDEKWKGQGESKLAKEQNAFSVALLRSLDCKAAAIMEKDRKDRMEKDCATFQSY